MTEASYREKVINGCKKALENMTDEQKANALEADKIKINNEIKELQKTILMNILVARNGIVLLTK